MNCYFASAVARRQRIEEEKSVSLQMRDYVLTAKATGFTDAALLPVRELVVVPEYRKFVSRISAGIMVFFRPVRR